MVRTIDGEERRRVLADAVWSLLRAGGLEAASVRAVASEAGLSTGSVRHFFASQDALHVFAMEELSRRLTERVQQTLQRTAAAHATAPPSIAALASVRAALHDLLPLTPATAADYQAHLQFIAKAVVHPPLAPTAQQMHRQLETFYAMALGHLLEAGAARADVDVPSAARELAVLMEGLVLRRLTAPDLLSIEQATAILDAHLASLAPGGESL